MTSGSLAFARDVFEAELLPTAIVTDRLRRESTPRGDCHRSGSSGDAVDGCFNGDLRGQGGEGRRRQAWQMGSGLQVSAGQALGDAGPPQFVSYRFANNYGFGSASADALRIVSPLFAFGAFAQVARSGTESFCSDHVYDCSANAFRFGLEARIGATRTASRARFAPWLGAGVAYEILHVKGTGVTPYATHPVKISYPGIDLRAQGGVDLLTWYGLRIGPFVELSIGRYFLDHFDGCCIGLSSELHESLGGGLHASLVF